MTDAEYIFRTDAAEKKRTGRSVQKKNRTGKGAVRFPSDYMTRKERTSMNGEIKTYNLNAPMTYVVFKSMPEDLQREYLRKLDAFNVPSSDIAEMLGAGLSTLYAVRKRLGVYNSFPSRSAGTKSRWAAFLNGRVETTHFDPAPEAPPPLDRTGRTGKALVVFG